MSPDDLIAWSLRVGLCAFVLGVLLTIRFGSDLESKWFGLAVIITCFSSLAAAAVVAIWEHYLRPHEDVMHSLTIYAFPAGILLFLVGCKLRGTFAVGVSGGGLLLVAVGAMGCLSWLLELIF